MNSDIAKEGDRAMVDSTHDGGWYLAYTKPRQEQLALQNLEQQSYEAYLPLFKKFKATEQGHVAQFEVMFPRYIFFRPGGPQQGIAVVRSTKWMPTDIRFGVEPAVLHHELVQRTRQMEQERNQATLQDLSTTQVGSAGAAQEHDFGGHGVVGAVGLEQACGGVAGDLGPPRGGGADAPPAGGELRQLRGHGSRAAPQMHFLSGQVTQYVQFGLD